MVIWFFLLVLVAGCSTGGASTSERVDGDFDDVDDGAGGAGEMALDVDDLVEPMAERFDAGGDPVVPVVVVVAVPRPLDVDAGTELEPYVDAGTELEPYVDAGTELDGGSELEGATDGGADAPPDAGALPWGCPVECRPLVDWCAASAELFAICAEIAEMPGQTSEASSAWIRQNLGEDGWNGLSELSTCCGFSGD